MNLKNWLRYRVFADTTQHGEFGVVRRLLRAGFPRTVVDVGANDGFGASNSYPFIMRGWRALLIEPHPEAFKRARLLHASRPHVTCLNVACAERRDERPLFYGTDGDEGTLATLSREDNPHTRSSRTNRSVTVRVETLADLLRAHQWEADFGLLSIDTEGLDLQVLQGLDLTVWRPRVIITEDYYSNEEKFALLKRRDYVLHSHAGSNTIWVSRRPLGAHWPPRAIA